MRYQAFWFRATTTEQDGTPGAFVFVAGNMEEARSYATNITRRSGTKLNGVSAIDRNAYQHCEERIPTRTEKDATA